MGFKKKMRPVEILLIDDNPGALLEGGYNHDVLPKNVDSFCKGFN